jgi:hypothetical protein
MATGANHRPGVGYAASKRLFVHLAILADASGEPRSITYRRIVALICAGSSARSGSASRQFGAGRTARAALGN